MEPSCRSGLPAVSRTQNYPESHVINPLLTKFARSRWLAIGLVLFLRVYGPRLRLGPQTRKKKRIRPISSHLDRANLVNNPYLLVFFINMRFFYFCVELIKDGKKRTQFLLLAITSCFITSLMIALFTGLSFLGFP